MADQPEWQLVFVLPNLSLGDRSSSPTELTLGLEGLTIVRGDEARVSAVRHWSKAADTFLGAFHDGNGSAIQPAALLIREDWAAQLGRDPEPIIAFRNGAALASILLSRASRNGGWMGVSWSDSFDYHPAQLRLDGSKFDLWTPALNSIGFRLNGLSLTPDLGLARTDVGFIDEHLAARLGRAWRRRYIDRRQRQATARVFRSLEAAYEASAISFRSYSSLNEVGMDAVDWTTAIEVLASPKTGDVSRWDCVRLLGAHNWAYDPELSRRRYSVARQRRSAAGPKRPQVNLVQKVFLQLHNARSKFVHGDAVSTRLLRPFGDEAPTLLSLASTIYRVALVSYLEQHWAWPNPDDDTLSLDIIGTMAYERHLLSAIQTDDD